MLFCRELSPPHSHTQQYPSHWCCWCFHGWGMKASRWISLPMTWIHTSGKSARRKRTKVHGTRSRFCVCVCVCEQAAADVISHTLRTHWGNLPFCRWRFEWDAPMWSTSSQGSHWSVRSARRVTASEPALAGSVWVGVATPSAPGHIFPAASLPGWLHSLTPAKLCLSRGTLRSLVTEHGCL